MTIALCFLAIILATLLGWLLKQTFNTQPWVAEVVGEQPSRATWRRPSQADCTAHIAGGRVVVLCVDTERLFPAYGAGRLGADDRAAVAVDQHRHADLASIAFQWTRNAAVNEQQSRLRLA